MLGSQLLNFGCGSRNDKQTVLFFDTVNVSIINSIFIYTVDQGTLILDTWIVNPRPVAGKRQENPFSLDRLVTMLPVTL